MELIWSGKDRAKKTLISLLKTAHERPVDINKDSIPLFNDVVLFNKDNRFILPYLKNIDIVYADPPYNTRQILQTYNDNFTFTPKEYKEKFGININKPLNKTEEMDRLHSKWLNLMYVEIGLICHCLAPDGVFFCSIDENELYNLKLICDEIFGSECFQGQLNWIKTDTPGSINDRIRRKVEYILVYTKTQHVNNFQGPIKKMEKTTQSLIKKNADMSVLSFPPNTVSSTLGSRRYKAGRYGTKTTPIDLMKDCQVKNGMVITPLYIKGSFKWNQDYLALMADKKIVEFSIDNNFIPSYHKTLPQRDIPTNLLSTLECNIDTLDSAIKKLQNEIGYLTFDPPKPDSLIEYLCDFTGKEKQTILDPFAGNGTTGLMIRQHNAYYGTDWKGILIENQAGNIDIIQSRIRNYKKQ